ncbi:hypothetical protein DFH09DRAFT_1379927 [Mycena vulgaris]|nr:hypothetical protein DFH09DRAFT_1379927 [Mycena vulgaris]
MRIDSVNLSLTAVLEAARCHSIPSPYAPIKEKIRTPSLLALALDPKHVLGADVGHELIVDAHSPARRVRHIKRVVPARRGHTALLGPKRHALGELDEA